MEFSPTGKTPPLHGTRQLRSFDIQCCYRFLLKADLKMLALLMSWKVILKAKKQSAGDFEATPVALRFSIGRNGEAGEGVEMLKGQTVWNWSKRYLSGLILQRFRCFFHTYLVFLLQLQRTLVPFHRPNQITHHLPLVTNKIFTWMGIHRVYLTVDNLSVHRMPALPIKTGIPAARAD